jgi:hypothetical protein
MKQVVSIPDGVSVRIGGPKIKVKPGKVFRRGYKPFGMSGHDMDVIREFEIADDGPKGALVAMLPQAPAKGPLRLLHTNPNAFFRAVVRQVMREMPV